jgi:hypothetical protein
LVFDEGRVVQIWYVGGTNIISTDPSLGTLGDYGGFTRTIPLPAGSPAINATNSNFPATDQRGVPRSNPTCDISAYDYVFTTKPVVNTFTVTAPSNSLNNPTTVFTASDTCGVIGYLITENTAVPAAGTAGYRLIKTGASSWMLPSLILTNRGLATSPKGAECPLGEPLTESSPQGRRQQPAI